MADGEMRQFKDGGVAYVYLCYGMHNMLNVVADKAGSAAAVLIRSCSPVVGKLETLHLGLNPACALNWPKITGLS
jgi:3-methyladenine DNA glycosylase Mpg